MSDELAKSASKGKESIKTVRKFRWSSCLSFVSNKLKRSSKLNNSKSFENLCPPLVQKSNFQEKHPVPAAEPILSTQWKPISALSPPPRQPKVKREPSPNSCKDRIPLVDPTLTPRVRPFSRGRQQSFLRLSLDADCQEDGSSLSTQSSLSTAIKSTRHTSDASIPHKWAHSSFDSPLNDSFISQLDEDEFADRLTLKERRQRKSPLRLPDSLTLTLEEDVLDTTLFQDKSRQETMMILEGKKPIVNTRELDKHFNEQEKPLQTISESQQSIPETPPYHQQLAPSLISVPSTPNSLDSSVIDHDDYIVQQHTLAVYLASN